MGALPHAHPILDLPAPQRDLQHLWQAWRLRQRRRRLIFRALRKRRDLTLVADRTAGLARTAILCVLVVRNEAERLAHFLAHHRRLGVDHFLVVDNASTDATPALLRDQPDVSLWQTAASYKRSRFGLDWTNWLLLRHGHGRWCLTLDADELLVYPHWETRPLPALTRWLDDHGQDSFGALMLDLYPEGPLTAKGHRPGDDPLATLRWFDAGNYSVQVQPRMRNLWIQGGARARAFFATDPRRAPTLNKLPLVRWHWRYAYVNSTHAALPPRLNAVFDETGGERISGVLLHTKFLPSAVEKAAEEKGRRQHFANPSRYAAYYDGLLADPVLHCPASLAYTGWRQLEGLGLMSRGGWL
ncbi:glycosyltransferase family 2 protein [Rhodobacter sp. Har01]|uniref:glycosyltransferase family 2 protein n=1 Tax=Rhodobacter sp. Har01 TaxID=2883999 RepID=UPI001D07B4F9|nr:glycosyltransferase family 2 protein [Rhodobacter sp. Har01]MCB6178062.1 glycosyltransferase family 2 protein [Rhodobacter sp. Har01]